MTLPIQVIEKRMEELNQRERLCNEMIDEVQRLLIEMKRERDTTQKNRQTLDDKIREEISSF